MKIRNDDIDLNLIERTRLLASEGHKEQQRKCGEPFINHPERIVKALDKYMQDNLIDSKNFYRYYNTVIPLGWMHDLVEDTPFKLEEIELLFGTEISDRLDLLTKRDDEDYFDYGNRILYSKNKLVYLVKLADLDDNLNSVGDGVFSKKVENKLAMRWEWLRFHLLNNLVDCR